MVANFISIIIRHVLHALSRWKILTAYVLFSGLTLSGWYVDLMGAFSNQEDYAVSFRATHGEMGMYNVLAFLVGTVFYLLFMQYDYFKLRMDKNQGTVEKGRASSVFGDVNQTLAHNNTNSPVVGSPGNTIIYNTTNGISEERCRTIFDEKWAIVIKELTFESVDKAEERRREFRKILLPRLEKENEGFKSFSDPGFQYLLMDAQKAAVTSDRRSDFELLSELLAQRVKDGAKVKSQIHIKKAIDVLPYVPDDALLGLTASFMLLKLIPLSGDIAQGLQTLDNTYKKIIGNGELPYSSRWVDTLGACGLVNIAVGGILSMNKAIEILSSKLAGYCLPGIKKDSENYHKAVSLLNEAKLPSSVLVDHELNSEYVRLAVVSENQIDQLKSVKELKNHIRVTIYTNGEQKSALHQVYNLYESDENLRSAFVERLDGEIQKYQYLKKVIDWWNQIPEVYQMTFTGELLANANANIIDSQIPVFDN